MQIKGSKYTIFGTHHSISGSSESQARRAIPDLRILQEPEVPLFREKWGVMKADQMPILRRGLRLPRLRGRQPRQGFRTKEVFTGPRRRRLPSSTRPVFAKVWVLNARPVDSKKAKPKKGPPSKRGMISCSTRYLLLPRTSDPPSLLAG
jgi:hypothetical protein